MGAQRGLTLVELLAVLALVAIVTGMAAPSLTRFTAAQRVKALSYDLTTDLLFARSEALKRNAVVTVTPRAGGWNAGWAASVGGAEILAREASGGTVSFGGAPAAITFGVQGRVSAPAAAVRITLSASGLDNRSKRCVELDLSGRARSRIEACPA
jgi:type IV fimbrial biogenesis protein FimT